MITSGSVGQAAVVHIGEVLALTLPSQLAPGVVGFLQLAGAGAIITVVFQLYRDRIARRDSVRDSILVIIGRVDEAYRTSKQIKRQLRARNLLIHPPPELQTAEGDAPRLLPDDLRDTPEASSCFLIPVQFFEGRMDELSRVQLTLEEIRQIIRVRRDLFPAVRIDRLLRLTSYSDNYLHDVIEDFEKRRMRRTEHGYLISAACGHLLDFLGARWRDPKVDALFTTLNAAQAAEARFVALRSIIEATDSAFAGAGPTERCRTKRVSDECLRAALAEMREAVVAISTGRRAAVS